MQITTSDYSTRFPQEKQLVERARLGDTDGLIEHLYGQLKTWAYKLVTSYPGGMNGPEDLLQTGALAMVLAIDKALSADSPCGWLLRAAKMEMLQQCREHQGLMRVPYTALWRGKRAPLVLSLDAPLPGHEDLTLLDVLS